MIHPTYFERVRASFDRQSIVRELNVALKSVEAGSVELQMPYDRRFTQQHGFIHAGIVTTVLDNACGYAAFSLMPEQAAVLTAEFKVNFLSPAKGETFVFRGAVVKSGRILSFTEGQAYSINEEGRKLIATMSATLVAVFNRDNIQG